MTNQFEVVLVDSSHKKRDTQRKFHIKKSFFTLTILLSLLVGFGASNIINGRKIAHQDFQLKTSGVVSLTESELIEIADSHNFPIYWSGPIQGYTYSLIIGLEGSSMLKYLPDSGTATSPDGSMREIATYQAKDAWSKSRVAASKSGISTFRNSEGNLVFYSVNNASDVFMAFKGEDVQVEIFDSRAGQALSLSMLAGQIRPVVNHEAK